MGTSLCGSIRPPRWSLDEVGAVLSTGRRTRGFSPFFSVFFGTDVEPLKGIDLIRERMSIMTTQLRYFVGAAAGLVAGVLLMAFAGSGSLLAGDSSVQLSHAIAACGPSERILTRQVVVNGQVQTIAECAPALGLQPASLGTTSAAPRATSTRSVARAQEPTSSESGRSWKKSALIIGGAAGAGAGIGGIAKGGKGALIGAAIGGGAAAIYEAIKRKD
jgi:hypothetical protein